MRPADLKISTRIGTGFLVMAIFTLALGLLAMVQLAQVVQGTEHIAGRSLPAVQLTAQMRDLLGGLRRNEARHMLSSERKEMKTLEGVMAEQRAKLIALDEQAAHMFAAPQEVALLAEYRRQRQSWFASSGTLTAASRAGKQDEATQMFNGGSNAAFSAAYGAAVQLSAGSAAEAEAAWKQASETSTQARKWLTGGMAAAFVLAAVMVVFIARSIANSIVVPIQKAVTAAQDIASGDMTVQLHAKGSDETANLLRSLEAMRTRLAEVVMAVRESSGSFAMTSAEIARGNQDLSERTGKQADALERIVGSMDRLAAAVRQNSASAQEGNRLAAGATQVAVAGRDAVTQVVDTMNRISASSRQIAEITSIIDGIAFQTNILALNAAVEAARAGEQGRGFAVVAAEVRSLARRCTQSAREINALISASVQQVESGTQLVQQAGSTMGEVVSSIGSVATLMAEITASSKEQSDGVAQVGDAVTYIDEVTRQNAALVRELAAGAGGLRSQADQLVGTVQVFKLERGTA